MTTRSIAREDVLALRGYQAGAQETGTIRLNANESPFAHNSSLSTPELNRYPEVRPVSLQAAMATMYGVAADNLLVTRGSSEAIDVLIRAYCRAYRDSLVITPPTFEMYRFYADLQGIERIEVRLDVNEGFAFDVNAVLTACKPNTKIVFVCSPNNPTGGTVSRQDILKIVEARRNRSIVVVDEAYIEFSNQDSLAQLVADYENLVVLRTLSKAQSLAGARCGVAIGHESAVSVMCRVLPPYSFPTPVLQCVQAALATEALSVSRQWIASIVSERERVRAALPLVHHVANVWSSQANFLLVQFVDACRAIQLLREHNILVRDFSNQPGLENCVRITIGSQNENDLLLAALSDKAELP